MCIRDSYGGKLGKVGDEVGAHTGKIGAGLVDGFLCHRDGDVPVLHHAVVGCLLYTSRCV